MDSFTKTDSHSTCNCSPHPQASLTEKDIKFREFVKNAHMWKVVLYVCTPLALYQSLNQLFKIFDSLMAAHIGASSVSAVAYLSQINLMLSALGGGLAVGASIKISEAYGAGDFILVKKRVSTLFAMCGIMGAGILLVLVPSAPQFLRLARTPESFIAEGTVYFILDLIGIVLNFFNSVYIAIERARGNSRRILVLNGVVILIKLNLTALFVYVLHSGINMIAAATIASQLFLSAAAWHHLSRKGNAFSFSFSTISLKPKITRPMLILSIPVIMEKLAFSFGKVVVNSMSVIYSPLTVGALGISNNLGGFTTNPQNGFQEGGSAIISQSLGAGEPKRALEAFKCVLAVCIGLGAVPLGANAAVMALLYGFGKTNITLFLNFSRVFLFRIPVLWALQTFTSLGDVSLGIVMAVSNILTGLIALIAGWIEVRRICAEYHIKF